MDSATSTLRREMREVILDSLMDYVRRFERGEEISRLEEVVKSADLRLIQSKDSFPVHMEDASVIRFDGDPKHAFVETFHALLGSSRSPVARCRLSLICPTVGTFTRR